MRSVIIAIILVIAGGGAFLWFSARKDGAAAAQLAAAAERKTTAVAESGDIRFSVTVAGEIGPAEQVSVRPEVNGRISELPVDVGDRVAKGGLLFALDDKDLKIEADTREKQIESARLQLDKARIAMEQAKREFDRDTELFEAKLVAEQVFESTRQKYESAGKDHDLARNSIERAQQDAMLSRERLLKTRIVAPFDCTVLTRPISVGQAVSGSGGFNSGTEVLTIADLSSMVINAHVNQADVTRLKQGMTVNVDVDAVPGLSIAGEVERIAPQATVRNNIKGYATRIQLKNVDPRVQPGMTASITIPVATAEGVLTVPIVAVFSEQGERFVYVKNGDSFERRPVVVGVSDLYKAEIKSGLASGDVVSLETPSGVQAATATAPGTKGVVATAGAAGGTRTAPAASAQAPASTPATTPVRTSGTTTAAAGTTPAPAAPKAATRPGT